MICNRWCRIGGDRDLRIGGGRVLRDSAGRDGPVCFEFLYYNKLITYFFVNCFHIRFNLNRPSFGQLLTVEYLNETITCAGYLMA